MAQRHARKRWVVKIGGSLDRRGALRALAPVVDELSSEHGLVISPGGGAFADFVRARQARRGSSEPTAHAQAVLAVCQYGYELAARLKRGVAVTNRAQALEALDDGRTPVFIPHPFVIEKGFPASWSFASDSMAAVLCGLLGFSRLALLKSVDGVIVDGKLRHEADAAALAQSGVADPLFPKYLRKNWEVYILNGRKPDRLRQLLAGGEPAMTRLNTAPRVSR